jgi:hypothetical protein
MISATGSCGSRAGAYIDGIIAIINFDAKPTRRDRERLPANSAAGCVFTARISAAGGAGTITQVIDIENISEFREDLFGG